MSRDSTTVPPALQERSRRTQDRILTAGMQLLQEVAPDQACPPGTFRHLLVSRNQVACLTRT